MFCRFEKLLKEKIGVSITQYDRLSVLNSSITYCDMLYNSKKKL